LELGHRGQYAAAIISDYESFQVPEILEHPKAGKLRLGKQVEAWLGTFFPEIQMRVLPSRDLGKAALRFKFSEATDEWLRPGNTGFGVTYCLPIIVAGLLAKPGSLLIVDSPEAHLHPSAQSAMGEFLSAVAVVGGQVIVETHSDHVLNGVRLAVMKAQLAPPPSEVMINHFGRRREQLLEQIAISPRGELSNHPIDFFDQAEKDLGEIVRQRFASQAGDLAG
jgi:predicted ATPase